MTTSTPVQSMASYAPLYAYAATGSDSVSRERKVDPVKRLPSEPNLFRQFGDSTPPGDTFVAFPDRAKDSGAGTTYSNLNPARLRR